MRPTQCSRLERRSHRGNQPIPTAGSGGTSPRESWTPQKEDSERTCLQGGGYLSTSSTSPAQYPGGRGGAITVKHGSVRPRTAREKNVKRPKHEALSQICRHEPSIARQTDRWPPNTGPKTRPNPQIRGATRQPLFRFWSSSFFGTAATSPTPTAPRLQGLPLWFEKAWR
jgi:hypothetical protein